MKRVRNGLICKGVEEWRLCGEACKRMKEKRLGGKTCKDTSPRSGPVPCAETRMSAWRGTVRRTIIVLVSSELACFVRTILQREENKGVEHTGVGANCL